MHDIEAQLKNLDLRLHIVELFAARMNKRLPVPGRSRGRPRGSRNLPKIRIGEALFDEHKLSAPQLVALSLVGSWVKLSVQRPKAPPLLSAVLDDPKVWKPAATTHRDPKARAWAQLIGLRSYALVAGELASLGQLLRYIEGRSVDDPGALRKGLDLVTELTAGRSAAAA